MESFWNYGVVGTDLWDFDSKTWVEDVGYDSFDWATATSTGQAGFGNASSHSSGSVNTPLTGWVPNTDLALTKDITIDSPLTGDVYLNVASDNGFIVFINGEQVAKENAELFTYYWEYELIVDSDFFSSGVNTISVLAEDHGGLTYFDMEMSTAPVPEPTTLVLMGLGLIGLAGVGRRKIK